MVNEARSTAELEKAMKALHSEMEETTTAYLQAANSHVAERIDLWVSTTLERDPARVRRMADEGTLSALKNEVQKAKDRIADYVEQHLNQGTAWPHRATDANTRSGYFEPGMGIVEIRKAILEIVMSFGFEEAPFALTEEREEANENPELADAENRYGELYQNLISLENALRASSAKDSKASVKDLWEQA